MGDSGSSGEWKGSRWDVKNLFDEKTREPRTFQDFGIAIQSDDVEEAGKILSELLGLSSRQGERAATHFYARFLKDANAFQAVMQIRSEIQQGRINRSMALVMENFGLDGLRAMQAVEAMKKFAN